MVQFEMQTEMPVSANKLFAWHQQNGALERLLPPWENLKVIRNDRSLEVGSEVHFEKGIGPFKVRWEARHTECIEGREFSDIQVRGPLAAWSHRHRMIPNGNNRSILIDEIEFDPKFGLGKKIIQREIERLFTYRHRILRRDLEVLESNPSHPLKIAITGASGLVGSELAPFLRTAGHEVLPLVRKPAEEGEIYWDPQQGKIDASKLEGVDCVIHLAGENIGSGRWTQAKKKRIRDSRVLGTQFLVDTLNRLQNPPKVLVSASAVGYYGAQCTTRVDEASPGGDDFLAQVCAEWEFEALKYKQGRVVIPRFGVILTPKGGALKKMLPPFKMGIGGKVGTGSLWMSWIGIEDLVYNLYRVLIDDTMLGPINFTAPHPVTNLELSKALSEVLRRPRFFPVPSFVLRLLFGEMADATILSSIEAVPSVLNRYGKEFYDPTIRQALSNLLGRE